MPGIIDKLTIDDAALAIDTEYKVYIDESGELGLKAGSSKYFLIAALSTANPKALRKRIKKKKAALISEGWPKDIEIKGTTLWGSPRNRRIPKEISDRRIEILSDIISAIAESSVKVHYSIAQKSKLTPKLLTAPYGVTYNYLAGKLLSRAYNQHYCGSLHVIVDQRNKETHSKLKFDGYIQTLLLDECDHCSDIIIEHLDSGTVPGLQAVDFMAWALFRYYEHGDDQFKKLIMPAVGYIDAWYPGK